MIEQDRTAAERPDQADIRLVVQNETQAQVLAVLYGEPLRTCPEGLYIPPDALRVILERFEGPLDLLLYLIKSQKFDVMDIPMAVLTDQYMAYVELVRRSNLELAAAYLVMAATLMHIKSRLLLPARAERDKSGEEAEDPRAELMRRLAEYQEIRDAARELNALPREGRDFERCFGAVREEEPDPGPGMGPLDVAEAWRSIMARLRLTARHRVARQELSVREHMTAVLRRLAHEPFLSYASLLKGENGMPEAHSSEHARENATVWYLALLELAREHLVHLTQAAPYAPIYVTRGIEPPASEAVFEEGP